MDKFDTWVREVFGPVLQSAAQPARGVTDIPVPAFEPDAGALPPPATPQQADPLQARVDAAVAQLEARKAQLAADGVPTAPIDEQIAQLKAKLTEAKTKAAKAKVQSAASAAQILASGEVARQDHAMTAGADKAIDQLLKAAHGQIGDVPDGPSKDPKVKTKAELTAKLTELDRRAEAAKQAQDPARAQLRKQLDQDAQGLLKAIAAASAKPEQAHAAVQAAFADALKEKYGISIETDALSHKQNTNFEKMYEVFESVPLSDVTHVNMRDALYRDNLNAIGDYEAHVSIQFGDFGNGQQPELPGRYHDVTATTDEEEAEPPPNAFKITVLHELGHSVDARWGLVDKFAYAQGGGNWRVSTPEKLAAQAIKSAGAADSKALEKAVISFINGAEKWPADTDAATVTKLTTALDSWMGLKSATYSNPVKHEKEGRNYFYNHGNFYSYDIADQQRLKVSDYQWSAPQEWFAELYAICWYKHRPPPEAAPKGLLPYLPQKSGAGGPASPG